MGKTKYSKRIGQTNQPPTPPNPSKRSKTTRSPSRQRSTKTAAANRTTTASPAAKAATALALASALASASASASTLPAKEKSPPTQQGKKTLDSKDFPNLKFTQEGLAALNYQSFDDCMDHCIAVGEIVEKLCYPDGIDKNKTTPRKMFLDRKFRDFIQFAWCLTDTPHQSTCAWGKQKRMFLKAGAGGVKMLFQMKLEVNITPYFESEQHMNERYAKDFKIGGWVRFVRRVTSYYLRSQGQCPVNGCVFKSLDALFGAIGIENDHGLENEHDVIGVLKKAFEFNTNALEKPWGEFLGEYAKTLSTCFPHHQNDRYYEPCWTKLPDKNSKKYQLIANDGLCVEIEDANPIAPCQVMDSADGRQVMQMTDMYLKMKSKEIEPVKFAEINEEYARITPFAFIDIARLNEETWDTLTVAQRKYAIRRAEITAIKKMTRRCFFCDKNALEQPAKQSHSQHLHHVLEKLKSFNPSEGPRKSLEKQRSELIKTIMLCCRCHMRITWCEAADAELMAKFKALGFKVNQATGEITCTREYDGLRIHSE